MCIEQHVLHCVSENMDSHNTVHIPHNPYKFQTPFHFSRHHSLHNNERFGKKDPHDWKNCEIPLAAPVQRRTECNAVLI